MKSRKILTLPVMAATLALVLSGCSIVVEDGPKNQQPTAQPTTAQTSKEPTEASEPEERSADEPSQDTEPSVPWEPTSDPSDGGGESQAPEVETITLTPESGVLYLNSVQGFSPELEAWVIDTETGLVEYQRYSCLGTTQGVGVGSIAPREDADEGEYEIRWEGENPGRSGHSVSLTQRATITERTLEVTETATTHHDIELERFGGMCKDAGEMVAGFVL